MKLFKFVLLVSVIFLSACNSGGDSVSKTGEVEKIGLFAAKEITKF